MAAVLSNVKVGFAESSPQTWTLVPQLTQFKFPPLSSDEIETTMYGSAYKRHTRGLIEVGEMTLQCIADLGTSSVHRTLRAKFIDGTPMYWRVEVAANEAWTQWAGWEFRGWVKGWEPDTSQGQVVQVTITVRFDDTSILDTGVGASEMS